MTDLPFPWWLDYEGGPDPDMDIDMVVDWYICCKHMRKDIWFGVDFVREMEGINKSSEWTSLEEMDFEGEDET